MASDLQKKGVDNPTFTIGEEEDGDGKHDNKSESSGGSQKEADGSQNDAEEASDDTPLVTGTEEPENDNYIGDVFREYQQEEDLWSFEQCLGSCRGFFKIVFATILFSLMYMCLLVNKGTVFFLTSRLNKEVDFHRLGGTSPTTPTLSPKNYGVSDNYMDDGVSDKNYTDGFISCGVPHCPLGGEPERTAQMVRWLWGVFLCQTAPYALMFLRSSWKMCFKVKDWPSASIFFVVMGVETLHTTGTFLLFYCLLPLLDVYRALFLLTGVAVVPSFLLMFNMPPSDNAQKPQETKEKEKVQDTNSSSGKAGFFRFLYVLAFLCQIAITLSWFIVVCLGESGREDLEVKHLDDYCDDVNVSIVSQVTSSGGQFLHNFRRNMYTNDSSSSTAYVDVTGISHSTTAPTQLPSITPGNGDSWLETALPEEAQHFWPLLVAPLLVSFGYWENFVDKHSRLGSSLGPALQGFRAKFNKCKTKTYLMVSLWKILLSLCLLMAYYRTQVDSVGEFGRLFDPAYFYDSDWAVVGAINFCAGVICFYTADIIIKGRLQVPCYTLPLALATPTTFALLIWACASCDAPAWDIRGLTVHYWNCYGGYGDLATLMTERYVYIGLALWLSELWLTRYLWFPKIEKLAKIDKIFIYPMFCGLSLEQSLMFIRRRNDYEFFDRDLQEHKKKPKMSVHHPNQLAEEAQPEDAKSTDTVGSTPAELVPGHNFLFTYDKEGLPPFIYICATMWHENDEEMRMMLISLLRLDEDQMARRMAQDNLKIKDPDYYLFEVNIFFDDAFTPYLEPEDGFQLNEYVTTFVKAMNASVEEYHGGLIQTPPVKSLTPYGGKLVWTLPSGVNKLVVHLKDKMRIRNRKRWSQVMYLHFFLAQGILAQPRSSEEKQYVADHTYILALDGDIDFQPEAVTLLLDLMKRNVKVAAACGRIHPTGNGFMVWYQKFEYSLSHWLQKATEHVLGCVLCSPGCFSMFRGSALMDDNVTASYSKRAHKAIEHVQYDQGEDRWLCTLLLQQGYRVEYSAAADAYTHAPVGFNEFFGQRRRWITSTFANIMDLLANARHTAKKNENISMIYMVYQGFLFASSILGPATIFMLVVGAFEAAFMIDPVISFFCGLIPLVIFLIICFKAKNNIQLGVAALLSAIYAVLQMLVVVGIARQMVEDGVCSPSAIFFMFIGGTFILAALIHPQELTTLFHGFLYFLLIPCMYLVLIIYSLCNLHVVSWGTRENKPVKTQEELEAERQREQQKGAMAVAKTADGWKGLLMSTVTGPNEESQSSYTCSLGACCKAMCCVAPGMSPENKKLNRLQRQMTVMQGQMMKIYDHVSKDEYECNPDDHPQHKDNNGKYVSNSGCENSASPLDTDDMLSTSQEEEEDELGSTTKKTTTKKAEGGKGGPEGVQQRERKTSDGWPTPDYDSEDALLPGGGGQVSPVKQKMLRKRKHDKKKASSRPQAQQSKKQPTMDQEVLGVVDEKPPPKPWTEDELIIDGKTEELHAIEERFWSQLITKYLYPLTAEHVDKEKLGRSLRSLRNKAVFAFFIIDLFLMVLILGLNLTIAQTPELAISWNCTVNGEVKTSQLDPIGFVFIIVFGIILLIQILGMLIHRLFTFLQIISATIICKSLPGVKNMDEMKYNPTAAIAFARELQRINRQDMMNQADGQSNNTSGYNTNQNSDAESGAGTVQHRHNQKKGVVEKLNHKPKVENHTTMSRQFAKNFLALKEEAKSIRRRQQDTKGVWGAPAYPGDQNNKMTLRQTLGRYRKNVGNNKHTAKYGQYLEQMVRDNELDGTEEQDRRMRSQNGLTVRDVNNQRRKVRSLLPEEFKGDDIIDDLNSLDSYGMDDEEGGRGGEGSFTTTSTADPLTKSMQKHQQPKTTNNKKPTTAAGGGPGTTATNKNKEKPTATSATVGRSSNQQPNHDALSRNQSNATLYSSNTLSAGSTPSLLTQLSLVSEEGGVSGMSSSRSTKDLYKFSNPALGTLNKATYPNGTLVPPGASVSVRSASNSRRASAVSRKEAAAAAAKNNTYSSSSKQRVDSLSEGVDMEMFSTTGTAGQTGNMPTLMVTKSVL